MSKLADTLERLASKHREPWYIAKEPHDYPDGTTHFTHVRYTACDSAGEAITVGVAQYVTPELGELLCALHNNLTEIIEALRKTQAD
jgi:hypothetical protein